MVTSQVVNDILGISESFQMPERLLSILLTEDRDAMFDRFMEHETDLSFDWFTDYFQEQHSNREAMMQDFTPRALTRLLPELTDQYSSVLDICSGTGGLTIGAWNKNHDAYFVCEELSERAFPILLFNLAIRGIHGMALNKDVLTGEVKRRYKLIPSGRYSRIEATQEDPEADLFDFVISNPPYSLSHEWNENDGDARFEGYGYPPTKAADYAFVLDGLSRLKPAGRMCAILPHGVLFRANREGVIRSELLKRNQIEAVIGLPEKLFLNTGIPVCVMVFRSSSDGVFFVDASAEYEKAAKQNILRDCDIEKIANSFRSRSEIEKYSHMASFTEVGNNNFNLNIPRYVSSFESEPLPDMAEVVRELIALDKEIDKNRKALASQVKRLVSISGNVEDEKVLAEYVRYLERTTRGTYEQLAFDL